MAANGQMQQQQPLMPGMGNAMSGMMGRPPASPYGATMQPQQDKSGGQAPGGGLPGGGLPGGGLGGGVEGAMDRGTLGFGHNPYAGMTNDDLARIGIDVNPDVGYATGGSPGDQRMWAGGSPGGAPGMGGIPLMAPGMGGPEVQQGGKGGGQAPGNPMRGIDPNFGRGVGMHAGGTPGFYNNQPPVSVGPTWEHRGY